MRLARRVTQLFFLCLFIFFFLQAAYPYNPWLPSDLFLRASPLVGLSIFLSSRSFHAILWMGLLLLGLSVLFGRYFCGWICPLGTLVDFSDKQLLRTKKERHHIEKVRSLKYYLFVFVLMTAIFSAPFVWFFDPLVMLFRAFAVAFYPIAVHLLFGLFNVAFKLEALENPVYAVYDMAQKTVMPMQQPAFINAFPILVLFIAVFALGFVSRRFWCRALCPLGALFGLFSKYRLLKRRVDDSCTACGLCAERCRMQAIQNDFKGTQPMECIECGQCVDECPSHSISYRFAFRGSTTSGIDLSRRHLLFAGIAAAAGAAIVKTARSAQNTVIRPPGAIAEEAFLEKCIRCQACTHICASTGACLHPAFSEAGLEGIWTPIVMPSIGYCEYNCTLCGQVCPTGAIQELVLETKQQRAIGTAIFDKDTCIPWRDHVNCLVCEEHCPVPDKAIKLNEREVRSADGALRMIKFPFVVRDLCIGCGICQVKCPLVGKPGIYVTAEKNRE